ncbi:DoxX-like family protein [Aquimarina sp. RZ0]|uniref:DoxX-like family protein n=1 Tax=Aquimarina sp. RZ0 TaxID=2607730 RepID=UPI0011F19076|nr:DoxX-like family protein [Aquimarina sp. RZ0]KAA1247029.1 hypothetical protein F0000_04915 [Aquimarina sp. RZ0]
MTKSQTQILLQASVFLIFIGRAYQHLFWDAPYRSFFWDESLLTPVVENLLNVSWQEYATSISTDRFIQNGIRIHGVLYLIAALCSLGIRKNLAKWFRIPIFLGGCSLVLLSILLTKEKFYHVAQFFEHSIQFGLPFILLYTYREHYNQTLLITTSKILIALTFFSHGLYAFGFYPIPGKFIDMVIQIFGCTESTAVIFLYIAGILDFVVAVFIFIPKTQKYTLWYAVFWGLLTALARIVANFYWDFPIQSIHQNLHEVLYRLSHGVVPLIVLYFQERSKLSNHSKTQKIVTSV